ncbi:MAG TPA: hypothetical protein VD837_08050 [Terriglobales bacterium]|nr:hypothetical protein [Terriglobales bacterium]
MRRAAVVLAVLVVWSSFALAADSNVAAVVNAIERTYGMKHTHLPWIARAAIKPAMWGSGASMKFEVFEDQKLPSSVSVEELGKLASTVLGPDWKVFIRASSVRGKERTVIYVKPDGKHLLMMIVAAERDETAVMKLRLNPEQAQKWMDEPTEVGRDKGRKK